ncbi:LPXTG cell wall anchor domain-containing protein, partial [Arthrobacter sp. NamB2]
APVVIAPKEPAAPAKGKLAYTGSTAGQIALGGLAVLLLGAGAVAASRVRRRGNA